jgi:hypothetical protein
MATSGSSAIASLVARARPQQSGPARATDGQRPFRRDLEDPEVSVAIDIKDGARNMLIAFGGMRGALGMPPFEFLRVTGRLRTSRIFVRDLAQAWYHRGVPGLGSTIDDAAAGIRTLLESRPPQRLVVTGTSAGGYAALVFGTLLGADVVLSIVPQTVVNDELLHAMGDHRCDSQLENLIADGALDPRWSDLRRDLPLARGRDTRCEVYFDPDHELDRIHAERLASLPGVQLNHAHGGHGRVARNLRDSGELQRILSASLTGGPR